jgi:hypothetical protein
MEANINSELVNIDNWLCAKKLSLNIEKSNYVIFHASQRTVIEITSTSTKLLSEILQSSIWVFLLILISAGKVK